MKGGGIMEAIYSKFTDSMIRSEYRTVMPVTDLNFNTPNNYTVFKLDHGDSFYSSRMMFHIQGEYVKKATGDAYEAGSNIKLVDNFAAFLFSRIEVKKHNTLIDSIDMPGITSMIKGLLNYGEQDKNQLINCGFASRYKGGGKFEALGTLGHFGLGFFDRLRYPMYKGGFEITFTRAQDNDALYIWKGEAAGAVEPDEGKIVIQSFTLRVPLVEYEQTAKIQLIDGLKTLSDRGSLVYDFNQWQCIDKKGIFGSSFSFDITNVYRNVYNPRFVIIALQTNRSNNQKKNPSIFDHCNIKNVGVKINGDRYPSEMQNVDIANERCRILYDQYQRFRKIMFNDNNTIIDPTNFINLYPLFVIDAHLHPINTDRSRSDIQVEMDFNQAIQSPQGDSGTTAYVIVVSDAHFKYDITRNDIQFV